VELVLQALIDAEAAEVIGADRNQRGKRRQTQRNGDRDRLLSPRLAMESLRIGKAPPRELLPEHPRAPPSGRSRPLCRRHGGLRPGGEHRQVDDLAAALGGTGISKSEVSRIVASLDEEMAGFRTRRA
jgi:putative transposase